eukprot:2588093-Rhodomonas_salina.1
MRSRRRRALHIPTQQRRQPQLTVHISSLHAWEQQRDAMRQRQTWAAQSEGGRRAKHLSNASLHRLDQHVTQHLWDQRSLCEHQICWECDNVKTIE